MAVHRTWLASTPPSPPRDILHRHMEQKEADHNWAIFCSGSYMDHKITDPFFSKLSLVSIWLAGGAHIYALSATIFTQF